MTNVFKLNSKAPLPASHPKLDAITTFGACLYGIEAHVVTVAAKRLPGMPGMDIVGLGPLSAKEARHRVSAAIRAAGYELPSDRFEVTLSPVELPKRGSGLDLAIAVAILAIEGVVAPPEGLLFYGELGLDGVIRAVPGALNAAQAGQEAGLQTVVGPRVEPKGTLKDLVCHLNGAPEATKPTVPVDLPSKRGSRSVEFGTIRGHATAIRAAEVAAAGRHNVLFVGPPGCGKTLIARALRDILPSLSYEQALETSLIHDCSGLLRAHTLIATPPFRAPHHSASEAALVGGGNPPMPGEVSLAHNGILFVDELPEFRTTSLDALAHAVRDRSVHFSRNGQTVTFPANVMLVGAMNGCPCGHLGDPHRNCSCTPAKVRAYRGRLGRVADLFDMVVELQPVSLSHPAGTPTSSDEMAERVVKARSIFARPTGTMTTGELEEVAPPLGPEVAHYLAHAAKQLNVPATRWARAQAVAMTIAALEGTRELSQPHIAEALTYQRDIMKV